MSGKLVPKPMFDARGKHVGYSCEVPTMREMEHTLMIGPVVIVEDPPYGMAITTEAEDEVALIHQWDDGVNRCTPDTIVVPDADSARKLAGWLCAWAAAQEQVLSDG